MFVARFLGKHVVLADFKAKMEEQKCFSSTDSVSDGFQKVGGLQRDSFKNMLFLLTLKLKWTSKSVSRVQIPLV